MAKYKNIVGVPFAKYIKDQLNERKKIVSSQKRSSATLGWLTNRTGWYRMSSGAVVPNNPNLAEKNILQGGLVSKSNVPGQVSLREGFNNSYIKSTSNDPLGFRPMPGITGLSVTTGGRWQTLLQADIEFTAYTLDQLDILSKLYMSLGVHVFIEWGHTPYVDNSGNIQSLVDPIDFFSYSNEEELLKEITKKNKDKAGNYGALLGRVYNFDQNINPDGSYSCKVKVMGPGAMVDSLRINKTNGSDYDPTSSEESSKYSSSIENALYSIKKILSKIGEPKTKKVQIANKPTTIGDLIVVGTGEKSFGSTFDNVGWFKNPVNDSYYDAPSYAKVLNKIYSDSLYKGFTIGNQTVTPPSNVTGRGNAYQLICNFDNCGDDDLPVLPNSFFNGYVSTLTYETPEGDTSNACYITLGHLFCLIQYLGIPMVEGDSGNYSPLIYLDFHPDNTLINTAPLQASVDPSICIVPVKVSNGSNYTDFFKPLNINADEVESFKEKQEARGNKSKRLDGNNPQNAINQKLIGELGFSPNNINEGKIFNVLINIDFAINTFKNLRSSNPEKSVVLREYLDRVLDGINTSLGKVNNLKLSYVNESNCLRIVDERVFSPIDDKNFLEISTFGKDSISYDYSFSSKVSSKLASQIVIAAQAADSSNLKDFPEDVLTYNKLNGGVTSRFSKNIRENKENSSQDTKNSEVVDKRAPQKLYDHLFNIYSLSPKDALNPENGEELKSYFCDIQNKIIKDLTKTNRRKSEILIPLEYTITIDGLAGILPYTAFTIPDNRLPNRYKGRIAFIVFSINHNFDNNKWTTTLRGQTINKP